MASSGGFPSVSKVPKALANTIENETQPHFKPVNGASTNADRSPQHRQFSLKPLPVENFRRLRVIVIGAGFSGIYLAIRIPEWLRNVDLTIYEKNSDVGGTWFENRYPGCACDIPAHSYVYTFEPNPKWSTFYATAPEIHQYLKRISNKYSCDRFMKFNHKVKSCVWEEQKSKWIVSVEDTEGKRDFSDEADIVISARGALNDPIWPQIEGLRSFKGPIIHSAAWDQTIDFKDKRIGVIGSGSSAIQIVPNLQRLEGTTLCCFIRSRTWISQQFGEAVMQKLGLDHEEFTPEDQRKFMASKEDYHAFRKLIETEGNAMHPFTLKDSEMSKFARKAFTDLMRSRLSRKPELAEYLIPNFAPGCRRLTPGPGFLEALTEDNVNLIRTPIKAMSCSGVVLEDDTSIELDVLVCATGFNAVGTPPFPVIGLEGQTIQDKYREYPEAYMSVVVEGLPNFFNMLGPNSGVASGSLTKIIEATGDYILKCIRKLQKEDIAAMHVKPRRVRDWSQYIDTYFQKTVFLDDCKTWYRKGYRIVGLWPGSTLHAIETLRSPRWEDYEYIYADGEDGNRLGWLGNGWSELQINNKDLSYYIEPENVDFPAAPLPEKTERWEKISFTH